MKLLPLLVVVAASFGASGCASYIQRPLVADQLDDRVHVVSTSASRRANFLADYTKGYFVCMEPQPDVRENISKALIAGLQGSAEKTDTTKKAKAEANVAAMSALATAAVQRSVALEYFRTGVFALCQQKYNQFVREPKGDVREGYEAKDLKYLFDRAAEIAMAEALATGVKTTPPADGRTPTQTMVQQLEDLSTLYNKVRETITPPASNNSPAEEADSDG